MFGKADYGVRKALDEIKYNKFKLGEPLLKIIFPILEKRDEKESAYKAFSNYLSNANYQFLIKQFEKEISISLRSAIILGIHKYNSPKNLNFILEQYEKKTVDASSVIIALSTFRQKKATTVLWNHFEKFGEYDTSRLARQSLIKIGVSEKKIEQKMSQILRTTENPSVIKSIIKHFSELQNYFLYPEPKSVLIKSKLVLKQSRIDELAYPVSRLTAPLHSKKISKIIIEYLNSSDRKLQEFAVVIINRYLTSFDFLVDWKAYENMIERLFEIQNEENGFNKKISNCLGNLLAHIKKPFLLDRIIKAGNETEKEETIINIISALRKNLPLFINHQNLIDFLLKHVHSKNRILRIGVVRHLIKMNSPKVIAEIEQLKSDKDPEIRNIISGKDEWYNTNYLEHYLQKEKKKEKANFTLSKKTKFFIEAKLKR